MPASRASSSPTMSIAPRPCSAAAKYRTATSSGPRSVADRKSALRAGGRQPLDGHVRDARAGWTVMRPRDQRVDVGPLALDLRLDRPVGPVPHPAADAEPRGLLLHRAAVPYALDAAADDDVGAHRHVTLRSGGGTRPRRASPRPASSRARASTRLPCRPPPSRSPC